MKNKPKLSSAETSSSPEAPMATLDDVISAQAEVCEKVVSIIIDDRPLAFKLRGFRYVNDFVGMIDEAKALSKIPPLVNLPPGDLSGEASFKPSERDINVAVRLAHVVIEPKIKTGQWLVFVHRNNFAALELFNHTQEILGMNEKKDQDSEASTLEGVAEAKAALEADTFPAEASGDQS